MNDKCFAFVERYLPVAQIIQNELGYPAIWTLSYFSLMDGWASKEHPFIVYEKWLEKLNRFKKNKNYSEAFKYKHWSDFNECFFKVYPNREWDITKSKITDNLVQNVLTQCNIIYNIKAQLNY